MRTALIGLVAALLCGCSAQNTNFSTLQFSGETIPYPDDYKMRAARALERQVAADVPIQISKPKIVVGANAFGPQRWYVCVRGAPNSAPNRKKKPVWHIAEEWLDPTIRRDELVLFYNATGVPSVRKSDGSPLCSDAEFETLTLTDARQQAA
ncbi:hypothetical protein [Devosia sp. A369]